MAPRNRIGELLVRARVIDELQLRSAMAQVDQWGGRVSRMAAEMGLASEDAVTQAIAQGLNMQRVHLGNIGRDAGVLGKLDVGLCEEKAVFPVALRDNGKTLLLAMADPTDLETVDKVASLTRLRVAVVVAGDREIERAIRRLYRNQELTYSGIRDPNAEAPAEEDENEFKIVDMSGKTVMKHINSIAPPPQGAPGPGAVIPTDTGSAAALLDDLLSGGSPNDGFTEEELQRLEMLRANQEKSTKILRALLELLLERGELNQQELAARMRG
jgi:hypothetical protein